MYKCRVDVYSQYKTVENSRYQDLHPEALQHVITTVPKDLSVTSFIDTAVCDWSMRATKKHSMPKGSTTWKAYFAEEKRNNLLISTLSQSTTAVSSGLVGPLENPSRMSRCVQLLKSDAFLNRWLLRVSPINS